ncbi:MAG: acyl-CoA dehydrogenase [Woeseiaceae bacterium]|nr:acyl-CoA dehydrogenase [Woeseiaceae bacterium]
MDFSLNEVQTMLADSIEKFIANEYDFDTRQKHSESNLGYSEEVWKKFAELGWTAVPYSEEDGGFDGGPVDMMVIMERLGRGLIVEPYLANIVLAGGALRRAGNSAQKSEWLHPIINGELQATLAFTEPQARYDIANILTTAVRDDESFIINGSKGYVLNGGNSKLLIVPARTAGNQKDQHGITLFGINSDTEGVSIQGYETIDGQCAAEIQLTNVSLTAANVIGEVDGGFETLQLVIADATFAISAEAVGIMNVLTEKTIEYTKNRTQFGVPISSFQALQHRMVEMYTACEQSRSIMMWAAMAVTENGEISAHAIHSLKYQICIAGTRVGEEAVQIYGGMGVTWEMDVAHYFKRLTTINLMFGNADWHLDRLANLSDP